MDSYSLSNYSHFISYDRYRGVISLISIQQGILTKGDKIQSCYTGKKYEVTELGIMHPEQVPTTSLHPGQVGYIACNMKESSEGILLPLPSRSHPLIK